MSISDVFTISFLKKFYPQAVIGIALLVFFHPLFFNKTLTNFSDSYAIAPWSEHPPVGWFHSNGIDGVPIHLGNPSDLLGRELLREGRMFSWNPYVGFGTPWLGAMQGAPYFPAKLISMFSPDYWRGLDVVLIVMLLIAGTGNFLLLRSMGIGLEGATFSALSYMFCQRLFLIINMPAFSVECLIPIMLYAIHEMVKRKSFRFALFVGALAGAQFLGGFPETSFLLSLIGGLFFLWLVLRDHGSNGALKRNGLLCLVVTAVTFAVSGFQLTEFGKLLTASYTAHTESYGAAVKEPFWLLPMFLPNFFGTPFESSWINTISPYDHVSLSLFCGVSTVLLAITALIWRAAPSRHYVLFFAALFFVFVGYDFGFPALTYVGHLPLFNRMSIAWNVCVLPFSLSVLAGFGMQSLRADDANRRMVIATMIYVIAVLSLCSLLPQWNYHSIGRAFHPLLYVVPLFGLAYLMMRQFKTQNFGSYLLLALLVLESYRCANDFKIFHYFGASPAKPPSLEWLKINVRNERVIGVNGVFPANTLMASRIRDIMQLDAMYPERYLDYAAEIWPGARSNVYELGQPQLKTFNDPLLDIAAVKYAVLSRPLTVVPNGYNEVYSDAAATIYRNNRAFARARYVPTVLELPNPLTPAIMKVRHQELQTGVFLEDYSEDRSENQSCPDSRQSRVEFLQDDVNEIRLRVDAPCKGFVVLADLFFPGWHATLNGRDVKIYKANYAFRAVEVGPGTSIITFGYHPGTLRFGVPLAIVTLIGVFVAGVFPLCRRGSHVLSA